MRKFLLLLTVLYGFTGLLYAQNNVTKDSTFVDNLLKESKNFIGTDSAKSIQLSMQAKEISAEINYPKGEAYALKNIGMVYYMKGKYVETLDYWNQSLQIFQHLKDDNGVANMMNNIGAIYFNQGADAKALEYILNSLKLAEKTGDTLRMISALINVGTTYYNKKDPIALNYLLKVIPLLENNADVEAYIVVTGDIGEIYFDSNNDAKALEYYQKSIKAARNAYSAAFSHNGIGKLYLKEGRISEALENHAMAYSIATKFDDKLQVIRSLRGTADVYMKLNKPAVALDYYNRAKVIAEQMDDIKVELQDLYQNMASAYAKKNDFENAFFYKSLYATVKDTLYSIETKKKLNQLQFDFELSKKEVEINLKESRIKSERQARMGTTVGLGLILIIAFIIYRNSLQKTKTNKILDKKNGQIEQLILNILPKEVATELQNSGQSRPRHFEEVSILFTDFKGFTSIADKLTPGQLVEELNECFIEFDSIIEKYNLEKIKTIGDSYMCAGNIPTPDHDHIYKIVKAALEIKDFIDNHNMRLVQKDLKPWEIRIGLHIGPVVAGVVGKKKYAYDIWGGAVNIASRMESNGTPGKVNVSKHTYELIKDRFECTYRGKIYAKNLGDYDMYYVDREKPSLAIPGEDNGNHQPLAAGNSHPSFQS